MGMEDKVLTSKLRQIREGLEMAYQRQGSGRNRPWELVLVIKAVLSVANLVPIIKTTRS